MGSIGRECCGAATVAAVIRSCGTIHVEHYTFYASAVNELQCDGKIMLNCWDFYVWFSSSSAAKERQSKINRLVSSNNIIPRYVEQVEAS